MKRRLGTSPLSDVMVRTVYVGIRHLDSTTGELYELPQLLKRCGLRLRGVSRALISQGVAGRKRCVENAGSRRLPHGCNLVPRQMPALLPHPAPQSQEVRLQDAQGHSTA